MGKFELLTNEWLRADGNKWIGRRVLCRFSDGWEEVLVWNGFYWSDQRGRRVKESVGHWVAAFYIYEKYKESEVI